MLWFAILIIIGYLIIAFLLSLKTVLQFEHEDDAKYSQGFVAKAASLLGLQLMWLLFCALPTDAFNARHNAGLDTELLWILSFLFVVLFLASPAPFAFIFYESNSDPKVNKTSPWIRAAKTSGLIFVGITVLVVALYFAFRSSWIRDCPEDQPKCSNWIPATIPFPAFAGLLMAFVGWFLVVVYVGLGLVATPLTLIIGFIDRPVPISPQEYSEAKIKLVDEVAALKTMGESIRERELKLATSGANAVKKFRTKRAIQNDFNKFKQSVHLMESQFEALEVSLKARGVNPVVAYFKLILGIFSGLLSAIWVVHIVLYILIPSLISQDPFFGFLDSLMIAVATPQIYILELAFYLILVGYLLACVMVGCFRFNMRMFCCCPIHPLKPGNTHMNSVLFNVILLILCSTAICHFSYLAFSGYARNTYAALIFGEYMANAPLIGFFVRLNLFIWVLLVWMSLCTVYLSINPRERRATKVFKMLWGGQGKKSNDGAAVTTPGERRGKKGATGDSNKTEKVEQNLEGIDGEIERAAGKIERSMNVVTKFGF